MEIPVKENRNYIYKEKNKHIYPLRGFFRMFASLRFYNVICYNFSMFYIYNFYTFFKIKFYSFKVARFL